MQVILNRLLYEPVSPSSSSQLSLLLLCFMITLC